MFWRVFFLLYLSICVFKLLFKDVIDSTKNQNRPQKSKKEEEEDWRKLRAKSGLSSAIINNLAFIIRFLMQNSSF